MLKNKLGRKLLYGAVLSLLVGAGVFALVHFLGYSIVDEKMTDPDFCTNETLNAIDSVQKYIDNNNITKRKIDRLDDYSENYNKHYFAVYVDRKLIYDSIGFFPKELEKDYEAYVYDISLADCKAQVYVTIDFETKLYDLADLAGIVSGLVVFILMFVLLVHKKLRYIVSLEKQLRILEGGDLDYSITVEGKDELGQLAKSIDDMRKSIVIRENSEKEAVNANKEMITALSHDIRTPLTSLLGYIELMNNGTYTDEKQMKHFILMSREKVIRIKEMTDRLFSYSLVNKADSSDFVSVDAYEFVQQILNDVIFELENGGFKVLYNPEIVSGKISIDPNNFVRVFDNVVSNIKKYGNTALPIEIKCSANEVTLTISFKNGISDEAVAAGTGIGINTCKSILKAHGGEFSNNRDENMFYSVITIPFSDEN